MDCDHFQTQLLSVATQGSSRLVQIPLTSCAYHLLYKLMMIYIFHLWQSPDGSDSELILFHLVLITAVLMMYCIAECLLRVVRIHVVDVSMYICIPDKSTQCVWVPSLTQSLAIQLFQHTIMHLTPTNIWESMGKPCSCTQFIKSHIFYLRIYTRYCKSHVLHLNVQWNQRFVW